MKNPSRLSFYVLSVSLLCAVSSVCRAEDSSTVRAAIEQAGFQVVERQRMLCPVPVLAAQVGA